MFVSAYIVSLLASIFLGFTIGVSYNVQHDAEKQLLEECQKELPRNEFCTLIAVPEEPASDD